MKDTNPSHKPRLAIPLVILAGGKSSRMGYPKGLLPFGGYSSLLEHLASSFMKYTSVYVAAKEELALAFVGRDGERLGGGSRGENALAKDALAKDALDGNALTKNALDKPSLASLPSYGAPPFASLYDASAAKRCDLSFIIEDSASFHPLYGVLEALEVLQSDVFITSCDAPFIVAELLDALALGIGGHDIAHFEGHYLVALFRYRALEGLRAAFKKDASMRSVYKALDAISLPIPPSHALAFSNLNTSEDYAHALGL